MNYMGEIFQSTMYSEHTDIEHISITPTPITNQSLQLDKIIIQSTMAVV